MMLITNLMHYSYILAVTFIQLNEQEGVLSEDLRSNYRQWHILNTGGSFLVSVLGTLVMLIGSSVTSMHYQGVKLVFASLDLPDLKNPFYVDDFEFLLDARGALTVHGFPVTLSRAWQLFQFIFFTSLTFVISLAYLSPY